MNLAKNSANNVTGTGALALTPGDVADAAQDTEFAGLGTLAVSQGPIGDVLVVGSSPAGSALVVTDHGDNSVAVVDPDGLAVRAKVPLGGEPVAAAAAGSRVYVATTSASYDSIAVLDADSQTIVATYPVDLSITALTVSRDGRRIVVGRTGRAGTDIAIFDTATMAVSTIDVAATPDVVVDALRISPDSKRLYAAVSDAYRGDLWVIDVAVAGVVRTVPIGSPIRDLEVSPDAGTAYVLACHPRRGGWLDVVDTRAGRIAATVRIGGFPMQLTLGRDGTKAYVVDHDDVLVICPVTQEIVGTIRVDALPACVAAGPDGGRLYIADYAGAVTMIGVAPARTVPPFQAKARALSRWPEVRELQPAL